jgi:hypothetical protein
VVVRLHHLRLARDAEAVVEHLGDDQLAAVLGQPIDGAVLDRPDVGGAIPAVQRLAVEDQGAARKQSRHRRAQAAAVVGDGAGVGREIAAAAAAGVDAVAARPAATAGTTARGAAIPGRHRRGVEGDGATALTAAAACVVAARAARLVAARASLARAVGAAAAAAGQDGARKQQVKRKAPHGTWNWTGAGVLVRRSGSLPRAPAEPFYCSMRSTRLFSESAM